MGKDKRVRTTSCVFILLNFIPCERIRETFPFRILEIGVVESGIQVPLSENLESTTGIRNARLY